MKARPLTAEEVLRATAAGAVDPVSTYVAFSAQVVLDRSRPVALADVPTTSGVMQFAVAAANVLVPAAAFRSGRILLGNPLEGMIPTLRADILLPRTRLDPVLLPVESLEEPSLLDILDRVLDVRRGVAGLRGLVDGGGPLAAEEDLDDLERLVRAHIERTDPALAAQLSVQPAAAEDAE